MWFLRAYETVAPNDPQRLIGLNLLSSWGRLAPQRLHSGGAVTASALSPDGNIVATGRLEMIDGWVGDVWLWRAESGDPLVRLPPFGTSISAIRFSPNGKVVGVASEDTTARLFAVATGKPIGPPLQHAEGVWTIAFSPNGKVVATTSSDKTARLWTQRPERRLVRHCSMARK
jgi:WD40 repeat protein